MDLMERMGRCSCLKLLNAMRETVMFIISTLYYSGVPVELLDDARLLLISQTSICHFSIYWENQSTVITRKGLCGITYGFS